MAHVEYRGKRSDGTHAWRAVEYIDGRKQQRTFRTDTDSKRAAQRHARKVLDQLTEDAANRPAPGTINDLISYWSATVWPERSPSTVESYRLYSTRISDRFGDRQAADVDGREITLWYNELRAEGYSAATINHTHRVFRALLRFGHKYGDLGFVATERARPPQHTKPELVLPPNEVIRDVLSDVSGQWGHAVLILAGTGMRRGEVVGLRWEDVSPNMVMIRHSVLNAPGGGVHVRDTTKGGRSRVVHIDEFVWTVLQLQRDATAGYTARFGESPWVFPDWRADLSGQTPRRPGYVSQMWGKHRRKHGFNVSPNSPALRLHDLRHWYATTAIAKGRPVTEVSGQLGHAQTSTTTNIYGHGTDSGRSAVAAAVSAELTAIMPESPGIHP